MKKTDVLIIGGSAAGMVAALTGKTAWPEKSFILVKKQKEMMVPCGIPYIFGTLESSQQNIMPVDNMLEKAGILSIVNKVVSVDTEKKSAVLEDGEQISFEKLVIATGSTPVKPKWLKGCRSGECISNSKGQELSRFNECQTGEMQKNCCYRCRFYRG